VKTPTFTCRDVAHLGQELPLSYRLGHEGDQQILIHYACGAVTYGGNDIFFRRCGFCYRLMLEELGA
jgi:hypothetical protein